MIIFFMLLLQSTYSLSMKNKGFQPGEQMLDTSDELIRAHQPHIFGPVDGTYYWYGSEQVGSSTGVGGVVNLYTSQDLYNWEFKGPVNNDTKYAARPSMLGKNLKTGKYVMWHKGGKSFEVATADSLYGPFHQVGSYSPTNDSQAGDFQAWVDPTSNEGWLAYSQKPRNGYSRAMMVLRLDETWTSLGGEAPVATRPGHLEAPAPFYSPATNKYYIWCSHTSDWDPNPAELLVADAMNGPWQSLGNPSNNKTTFSTQGSHVLPLDVVNGTQRLLYMGDRYEPYITTKEGSRYIFLAMEVRADGTVLLHDDAPWSVEQWPASPERHLI